MGRPFFWLLFFGRPKKSIAVAGPRTGVKLGFAVAKQIIGSSTDALHFRSAHPMALNIYSPHSIDSNRPAKFAPQFEEYSSSLTKRWNDEYGQSATAVTKPCLTGL